MGSLPAEDTVRLKRLAELLDEASLPDRASDEVRREVIRAVKGYLLPRLERPDGPLVVAMAGPGGAGKSHLVNRLTGAAHAIEGAVRPTTTTPTMVVPAALDRTAWADVERRLRAAGPAIRVRQDHGDTSGGVVLVDLPAGNEPATLRTLALADLVVLVVTPERYADDAPWTLLARLRRAGIPVWIALNRTSGPGDEVIADLMRRLTEAGHHLPVFAVAEGTGGELGGLDTAISALDGSARDVLLAQGVTGRTTGVFATAERLVEPLQAVHRSGTDLAAAAETEHDRTADAVRTLVAPDQLAGWAPGTAWPVVADRLAAAVTRRVGIAAGRTAAAWSGIEGGPQLLDGAGQTLWRHAPGAAADASMYLLGWEVDVARIIGERSRRSLAPARARQVTEVVMRRALGDTTRVPWRVRRRLKGGIEPAAEEAAQLLGTMAVAIVGNDLERFLSRLSPHPSEEIIGELVAITGHGVVDA